jgi:hypothetical protein
MVKMHLKKTKPRINLDDEELIKKSDDMVQDNTKISELEVHLPPFGVSWLPSPLFTQTTRTGYWGRVTLVILLFSDDAFLDDNLQSFVDATSYQKMP